MKASARRRSGFVLLLTLIGMAVASAMVVAALQSSVSQRKLLRAEQQRQQTRWLAESGVAKAIAILRDDADYSGEVWKIDDSGPYRISGAVVSIDVQNAGSQGETVRVIRSQAVYPADGAEPSKYTIVRKYK